MTATVSLIIPIYNAEKYLRACLQTVTAQTLFDRTQVLLVDDGSVDGSAQICDEYAASHPNVTVIHQENAGVSVARNTGIDHAAGEYIAFADADDLLRPQMLEQMVAAATTQHADLVFCDYTAESPEQTQRVQFPFDAQKRLSPQEVAGFMLRSESLNALWNKLFLRRNVMQNDIRMTPGKRQGEDREFILHYLACCEAACYVPSEVYFYRYVPSGAVRRQTEVAQVLVQQYHSDRARFAALGFSEEFFVRESALCFCERIVATIHVLCQGLSGAARVRALRALYADDALQTILGTLFPIAEPHCIRYSALILRAMQNRRVLRTRVIMRAMQARVWLFDRLHR